MRVMVRVRVRVRVGAASRASCPGLRYTIVLAVTSGVSSSSICSRLGFGFGFGQGDSWGQGLG